MVSAPGPSRPCIGKGHKVHHAQGQYRFPGFAHLVLLPHCPCTRRAPAAPAASFSDHCSPCTPKPAPAQARSPATTRNPRRVGAGSVSYGAQATAGSGLFLAGHAFRQSGSRSMRSKLAQVPVSSPALNTAQPARNRHGAARRHTRRVGRDSRASRNRRVIQLHAVLRRGGEIQPAAQAAPGVGPTAAVDARLGDHQGNAQVVGLEVLAYQKR